MLAAGTTLSANGILFRSIEAAADWQVVLYRTGFMACTMFVILTFRYRQRLLAAFRATGRTGLIAAAMLGGGNVFFTLSILNTTVANSLFILSASPFIAAVMGWLLLREKVSRVTLFGATGAAAGIGLMMGDGLVAGRMFGNLLALGTTVTHAGLSVTVRAGREVDMVPALCLGGLMAAALAAIMVDDFGITTHDLLVCAAMGVGAMGIGFMCFALGARHVPAAEVSLLALSEVILAPLWVWIGINEVPSSLTLAGGFLVLSAVAGQAWWRLRES